MDGWVSKGSDLWYSSETDFYGVETFGEALAGSENELLVGNPGHARHGLSGGAVHVIDKASHEEKDIFYSTIQDAHSHSYGEKVAISGKYAIVYSNEYSPYGDGSVEVLKKVATNWKKIGVLRPDDFSIVSFANDFDIQGNIIAVSLTKNDRKGAVRIYKIEDSAIDASEYMEILPDFDGNLEYFGGSLSLDPYHLVIGGYEVLNRQKLALQLFIFEKESITTNSFKQEARLSFPFPNSNNPRFKAISHTQHKIVLTTNHTVTPTLLTFTKVEDTWENATPQVIYRPDYSTFGPTFFNNYGSSGHLTDSYYITYDGTISPTELYTFDLESESLAAPVTESSMANSFGANFRASGSLGISGNITDGKYGALVSDRAVVFKVEKDGSLDSLFTVVDSELDADFGAEVALYGTNILISAPYETNDRSERGGALYAYNTGQAYVEGVSSRQSGVFGPNESIELLLTFSEPVEVQGLPYFELNIEAESKGIAYYSAGSGTDTLVFTYLVASGHSSPILDYYEEGIMVAEGGSIRSLSSGVEANHVLPPVGSGSSISGSALITINAGRPKPTFGNTRRKYNGPLDLPVYFDKNVTGFEVADIVVENATVLEVSGSGSKYTLRVEPTNEGDFVLFLPEGAVRDEFSQMNKQSDSLRLIFDTSRPEYLFSSNTVVASSNILELSFETTEEAILKPELLVWENGSIVTYERESDKRTHGVKVLIQDTNKPGSCLFPSGSLEDEAHNLNEVAHTVAFAFDINGPSVSIIDSPTYLKEGRNTLELVFNEPIASYNSSLIRSENATHSMAQRDGAYQLLLTPTGSLNVTVTFEEGSFVDLFGNPSARSIYRFLYDNTPPEVSYRPMEFSYGYIEVLMEISEPVNEILLDDFEMEGIESLELTKYVDGNYLLAIWPDQMTNVKLSLKRDRIYDEAGNYVLDEEFNQIITGLETADYGYAVNWSRARNELLVSLAKHSKGAQVAIYDMTGKQLYSSAAFTREAAISLSAWPSLFIVVLNMEGKFFFSKVLAR